MKEHERQKLIEQISQRIAELDQSMVNEESLASKKQKQPDDASANLDLLIQSPVANKLMQDHQEELSQLKRSLVWLDSEHAGWCELCESEIPVARLTAALGSRLCLACAEKKQQTETTSRGRHAYS